MTKELQALKAKVRIACKRGEEKYAALPPLYEALQKAKKAGDANEVDAADKAYKKGNADALKAQTAFRRAIKLFEDKAALEGPRLPIKLRFD